AGASAARRPPAAKPCALACHRAESGCVAAGRCAEHAAILAAELRRAGMGKNRRNPTERFSNWTTIFNELTWPAATAWALTEPGGEEHSGEDKPPHPSFARPEGSGLSLPTLQERTMDDEIQLISDGDGLAVIGGPEAVERFLVSEGLSSKDRELPRLGTVL